MLRTKRHELKLSVCQKAPKRLLSPALHLPSARSLWVTQALGAMRSGAAGRTCVPASCTALDCTCRVQRRSTDFALSLPGSWADGEQVLEDQRVTFSAGNVEAVPAIFVLQKRVGTVLHKVLDHPKIPPCACHHQRRPKPKQHSTAVR